MWNEQDIQSLKNAGLWDDLKELQERQEQRLYKAPIGERRELVFTQLRHYISRAEEELGFYEKEDLKKVTFADRLLALEEIIAKVRQEYVMRDPNKAYMYEVTHLLCNAVMVIVNAMENNLEGMPVSAVRSLMSCVPQEMLPNEFVNEDEMFSEIG